MEEYVNKKLEEAVESLNNILQKSHIEDISYYVGSKKRMFWSNFWAGIFRGIGIGIGFTIITAIVIILLRKIVMLNLPIIGDYLVDIIDIIKSNKIS